MAAPITTNPTSKSSAQAAAPAAHIGYLDGFRGLAAWWILFGHGIGELQSRPDAARLPRFLHIFDHAENFSHFVVAIFIVLSGYVLMLPVAKSADGRLRGGFGAYFRRRFLRIVPAYYAALLLSTALIVTVPHLATGLGTDWDRSIPAFTTKSILTHLLLIHNLFWDTIYRIDGPAWTVSTEWEIYFLLPLVLLPVWRRWGVKGILAAGLILGYAPHYLLHARFEAANPHFIFLFTLGMTASALNHNPRLRSIERLNALPWPALSGVFFTLAFAASIVKPDWTFHHLYLVEIAVGLGSLSFMVYATRLLESAASTQIEAAHPDGGTEIVATRVPVVLRVLQSRLALWLGAISYSLYVAHYPMVGAADALLLHYHVSATASLAVMLCLAVVIPVICYGFHLAFEKPFLVKKDRAATGVETSPQLSNTPVGA